MRNLLRSQRGAAAFATVIALVPLIGAVALTVTLEDLYDSEAHTRGVRRNNDGSLVFGIRASF